MIDVQSIIRQLMKGDKAFRSEPIKNFGDSSFAAFTQAQITNLRTQAKDLESAVGGHNQ